LGYDFHHGANITESFFTFAVTAVQNGLSLPALQKILGHDRLTTTEIYLSLSPEEAIREFQRKW
jgi:integrase/recombinase XerD